MLKHTKYLCPYCHMEFSPAGLVWSNPTTCPSCGGKIELTTGTFAKTWGSTIGMWVGLLAFVSMFIGFLISNFGESGFFEVLIFSVLASLVLASIIGLICGGIGWIIGGIVATFRRFPE